MIRLVIPVLLVILVGCGGKRIVLGSEPITRRPDRISTLEGSAVPIVIKGEVIEKGKRWLVVKDSTDKVKVETATTGFDVDDIPLHTTVTIAGICRNDRVVEATGLRTE